MNPKLKIAGCSLLAAIGIFMAYRTAHAGSQFDVAIPYRTGSNSFNLPAAGGSNAWSVMSTGSEAGAIVTYGTAGAPVVCPTGPIISNTSQLITTGTQPGTTGTNGIVGQLGLNANGQLIICGTAGSPGTWRVVP